MSKKADREKRERIEQEKSQRMQKFSSTLNEYLKDFAQYYRQDVPGEGAILLYQMGLQHLNEAELKIAFQESIKKCKFFPSVAEMLECLKEWKERQPQEGTAQPLPDDTYVPTPEEVAEFRRELQAIARRKSISGGRLTTGAIVMQREPGED